MNMDSPDGGKLPPKFEDSATVVLGVANPLVWLLVLPSIYYVLRRGIRERDEGALYLAGLFLITYAPFVLSPRPIWMNTSLTVLPYAIMAVACFVWWLAGRFRRGQLVISLYLFAVMVVATPLYLLACGKGMRIPDMKEYLSEKYLVQIKKTMPMEKNEGTTKKSAPAQEHQTND
jgi:hypothetical protein